MATNRPSSFSSSSPGPSVLPRRSPSTCSAPSTSSTVRFRCSWILGCDAARACMILLPRKASRRWIRWILLAKWVRYSASSRALSPPPTTAISLSRKKKPSHVAQALTPRPRRRVSLSRPIHRASAPVATITASAWYSTPAAHSRNGRLPSSTRSTSASTMRAPNRSACLRNRLINSGPCTPSGKPG